MSKRLERMRGNPAGDWTISDIEAVCREHGVRSAILCASLGSLVGALFEDGGTVEDIATEMLVVAGRVEPDGDGTPRARLDIALADTSGRIHAGRLVRGSNPVCITFELMLEET